MLSAALWASHGLWGSWFLPYPYFCTLGFSSLLPNPSDPELMCFVLLREGGEPPAAVVWGSWPASSTSHRPPHTKLGQLGRLCCLRCKEGDGEKDTSVVGHMGHWVT